MGDESPRSGRGICLLGNLRSITRAMSRITPDKSPIIFAHPTEPICRAMPSLAAFRRHDYAAAIQLYDEAIRCTAGGSTTALCNRSLARLWAGDYEGALSDAEEALEVLAEHWAGDGGGLHADPSVPTGKSHTASTIIRHDQDVPPIITQNSTPMIGVAWYRKVSTNHYTKVQARHWQSSGIELLYM